MKRTLRRIGKILGQIYVVFSAILWSIQGFFIFRPDTYENFTLPPATVEYEIVVDEAKGIKSRGYLVNPTLPGPVILFFGGRGDDAVGYTYMMKELNVPVVLPNYRGHVKSDGRPSEKTTLADGLITLHMVREQFPNRPVVLMGDSVGSAVAIRIVDSNIAGMVLVSPFRSLAHVANRSILRIFPLRLIMRHKFDTRSNLHSLPDKVLVVYSKNDEIILAKETERILKRIPQADLVIDNEEHAVIIGGNIQMIRQWLVQNFESIESGSLPNIPK